MAAKRSQMKLCALITGGSRGIGLAIAQSFAAQGINLILLAKHIDKLERAKAQILSNHPNCQVQLLPVDMQFPEQVDQAVSALLNTTGHISILINDLCIYILVRSEYAEPVSV